MALAVVKDEPHDAGHNSFELSDGEKRALLVNSLVVIEGLVEQKDDVVGKIRAARKKLVANGYTPKVIDFALRLRKDEDDAMVEQRRAETEVARFLNHPIGLQADLFDQPDRTPEVDRAFALGEIAGAEGKTCVSPHSTGSPQEQAWIKGWGKGQDTIASAFKKLAAKEAAIADDDEDDGGDED